MKLRMGFVSNSSSSSYIVETCANCDKKIIGDSWGHMTILETEVKVCSASCQEEYLEEMKNNKEAEVVDLMLEQAERFKLMDLS